MLIYGKVPHNTFSFPTLQALTKRNVQNGTDQGAAGTSGSGNTGVGPNALNESMLPSSLRRKNSAPSCFDVLMNTVSLVRTIPRDRQKLATLAKQLGQYIQFLS